MSRMCTRRVLSTQSRALFQALGSPERRADGIVVDRALVSELAEELGEKVTTVSSASSNYASCASSPRSDAASTSTTRSRIITSRPPHQHL